VDCVSVHKHYYINRAPQHTLPHLSICTNSALSIMQMEWREKTLTLEHFLCHGIDQWLKLCTSISCCNPALRKHTVLVFYPRVYHIPCLFMCGFLKLYPALVFNLVNWQQRGGRRGRRVLINEEWMVDDRARGVQVEQWGFHCVWPWALCLWCCWCAELFTGHRICDMIVNFYPSGLQFGT
jgi:hypothetical protein